MFDVAIIGAGPVGLGLAGSLSDAGFRVALIERQAEAALRAPSYDGREIALTHRSVRQLERLGAWQAISAADIAPLRAARVVNGPSLFALDFKPPPHQAGPLGHLVANAAIRRALFEVAAKRADIALFAGSSVRATRVSATGAAVELESGEAIAAKLLVAADARLSETRRRQGISASMTDFGKVMLVCRMEHERPHEQVATEFFDYGQTLALLPLNGQLSSIVLTLPAAETDRLTALDAPAFSSEMTRRLGRRFGRMRLAGTRHCYPLVAVYANRFVGSRFALAGDAAVGMHPVTAHGFNLGLHGQEILAGELRAAVRRGAEIGDPAALLRFEAAHRRATRPLYLATNAIAKLYTDDRPPARLLRHAALRAASHLPLIRQGIVSQLL